MLNKRKKLRKPKRKFLISLRENKKKEIMSIPEERQLFLDEETGVLMADEEDRADEATATWCCKHRHHMMGTSWSKACRKNITTFQM